MTDTLILTTTIALSEEPALHATMQRLFKAHRARLSAQTDLRTHKATPRPAIKNAYASFEQYRADERAWEEWNEQLHALANLDAQRWREEQEAIREAAEYLPFDIWFRHGCLAVAITSLDEETTPQVVVDEWNDEFMPDLRDDERRAEYLNLYPQIIG